MNTIRINLSESLGKNSLLLKFGELSTKAPLWIIQDGLREHVKAIFESQATQVREAGAFTEEFQELLTAARPDWDCIIQGPLSISFSGPNGSNGRIGLGHLHAACKAAPEDRRRLMGEFLAAVTQSPVIADDWPRHILPVLRNAKPDGEIFHQIDDQLWESFVVDSENTMAFVSEKMAKDLGMSKKELRLAALKNLQEKFPVVMSKKVEPGVYQALADGNYDASLILDKGYWDKQQHPIQNEFLFAIPSRDQLYFCDSNDTKGLKTLRHLARTGYKTSAYPISEQLFVWRQGELRRFER